MSYDSILRSAWLLAVAVVLVTAGLPGCGGGGSGTNSDFQVGFAPVPPGSNPPGADTTPPTVSNTSPVNSATNVALNSSVSANFSKDMLNTSLSTTSFTLATTLGGTAVTGAVVVHDQTATLVPTTALSAGTQYTATITTAVKDLSGNSMQAAYSWTFTTGASSDNTPPTVSATSPSNNAVGTATNSSISATFSEAMANSTVNASSFTLVTTVGGNAVIGAVNVSGNTATFTPSSPLADSTTYTATVTNGVVDAAGNPMTSDYSWNFITAAAPDIIPPTVLSASPASAATGVALNSSISATFSEAMKNSTLTNTNFTLKRTSNNAPVAGTVGVTGTTARFTPSANLAGSTQFTATISTAVQDAAGNLLAAIYTWNFTTAAAPDTTPPTITSRSPTNGATGVTFSTTVSATFSEAMNISTLSTGSFTLARTTSGVSVSGTVDMSGNTVTFTPSANLDPSTQYTATITTAAQDAAGNHLAASSVWVFLTAAGDTTPPTVSATSPAFGATGVALTAVVSATFSEPMSNATLNTTTFTLAPSGGGAAVSGSINVVGNTATLTPASALGAGTYTATIATGAQDAAGNALAASFNWSFTTTSAPATTATLTWDAVTTSDLGGYRVYYGTSAGNYSQPLGSGITVGNVLTYTVTGLTSGTRYYFAVTAFDSSGNESGYSNEVSKLIP